MLCWYGHLNPSGGVVRTAFDIEGFWNERVREAQDDVRERSGSVVECLTGDRGAAGSSLSSVTVLWSLSKTHLSKLSTVSTQDDPFLFN